jgi:hypothetical protein
LIIKCQSHDLEMKKIRVDLRGGTGGKGRNGGIVNIPPK